MSLKGLPSDFDSLVAVLNFSTAKGYYEMNHDLNNFAATRYICISSETPMAAFHSAVWKPPKCFKCAKEWTSSKGLPQFGNKDWLQLWSEGAFGFILQEGTTKELEWRMWLGSIQQPFISGLLQFEAFRSGCYNKGSIELLNHSGCNRFMIENKDSKIWTRVCWQTCITLRLQQSFRDQRTRDSAMLCDGQYRPLLSTRTKRCLLGAILRKESGVRQTTDEEGRAMVQFNGDPTHKMPK